MSCGSLLIPKIVNELFKNLVASSPQNSPNCSVDAAFGSLVFPITLPEFG